ncbi:hypothetical protein FHG87_013025 [Trinorchestia longiramus]|nr:hypothetical protein FHG87_013025 [Trinorchestia longiramus]
MVRIGGSYCTLRPEAEKVVCFDPDLKPQVDDCLVYSFGVGHELSFDMAIADYGCDVFAFDSDYKHMHYPRNIYPRNMSRRGLNDRQIFEILQSDDEDGNFSDISGASDDSVNDPNYKIDDDKTEESSDIEESADDTLASDEDPGQEEDSQQDEDEHQGEEDARQEKDDQQEEDEHQIEYEHQEDVENQASGSTKRKAKITGMPSQKKQKTSEEDKETTVWLAPGHDLELRLSVTTERNTNCLSTGLHRGSSELQFFEELFPKSLFL